MLSFGLIKDNMELAHIYQALDVKFWVNWRKNENFWKIITFYYRGREFHSEGLIPPRGRRNPEENYALSKGTEVFKKDIWTGPAHIPVGRVDPTGW